MNDDGPRLLRAQLCPVTLDSFRVNLDENSFEQSPAAVQVLILLSADLQAGSPLGARPLFAIAAVALCQRSPVSVTRSTRLYRCCTTHLRPCPAVSRRRFSAQQLDRKRWPVDLRRVDIGPSPSMFGIYIPSRSLCSQASHAAFFDIVLIICSSSYS